MTHWREHNGDTTAESAAFQRLFGGDSEIKPVCWHCCKAIEDDQESEVVCGDMLYHVDCLID